MKIALLKGNRFNPWHLQAFQRLRGQPQVVAFRAESEIQDHFRQRGEGSVVRFPVEPIHFDNQAGPPWRRALRELQRRLNGREPRILPFHQRLQHFNLIQSWELFTDWSAQALIARKKWDIPLSIMVWDNIPFNMERNAERRRMKQAVAAGADRFIVHTERSQRMLDMEGVPENRIVRINPGVDTRQFRPGPSQRQDFGLEPSDFVILFVGWLLPRKGLDFLLLALRELLRDPALRDHPIKLLVIGAGPGKDRIEQLVQRLQLQSICRFAGSQPYDAMPGVFRAADVFVLPSIATPEWQEQFGMSLLEAMACGVPVISTYSGAIPEITGGDALLCQPNDFVSLYEALRQCIQDERLRRQLAQAALQRVTRHYTLAQYTTALANLYENMLGAPLQQKHPEH